MRGPIVSFRSHRVALLACLLVLFLSSCVREETESAPVVNGWKYAQSHSPSYSVRPGDSLYSIAWSFGLDYRQLAINNDLSPPYALNVGQRLNMVMTKTLPPKPRSGVSQSFEQQAVVLSPSPSPQSLPTQVVVKPTPRPLVISYPNRPVKAWIMPAQGKIIHGFSNLPLGNKGIDLRGNYAEPIVASAAGQVVYAGDGIRGYGNLIILKHNDNYLSAYAYNKVILVKEGAWVRQGQAIGTMGRTDAGIVSLHFEIRRNGQPVNPLLYLNK